MNETKYMMFGGISNQDLISLLRSLIRLKLNTHTDAFVELDQHEHPRTKGSQFRFLNRSDLLELIYSILIAEIKLIDETPYDKLEALRHRLWSCSQLVDRIEYRITHKDSK